MLLALGLLGIEDVTKSTILEAGPIMDIPVCTGIDWANCSAFSQDGHQYHEFESLGQLERCERQDSKLASVFEHAIKGHLKWPSR